ncbi:prenyltransferase/squalene oxidase repeat-containing protein [Anatilimnocola sp. NA78]|uniref:prenyltransferase/squalene oxidase repeat-containing protein n=1 Tax=Anatilimnocola sp. NA78 TaxID=3415683 RepID=UPI003CE47FE0
MKKFSLAAIFLGGFLLLGLLARPSVADEATAKSLARGAAYLASQQAKDGGWHSQAYGQLKGGAAVTSLALDALSQLPAEQRMSQAAAIERGFTFLQPGFTKKRTIASPDGSLDFPAYGCSLWLMANRRLQRDQDADQATLAREYLLNAQLLESRGFASEHVSYGGWDFLGADDAEGITTGTNVSVVAHALEALQFDESLAADKARTAARGWLLRTQQTDGGFCFTPEPMSLNNKAEWTDEGRTKPRSYGTATCDGIRGLLATGLKPEDEPVKRAVGWLAKRPSLEVVPGFEDLPAETDWRRGLRYYYYHSLARALPLLPPTERLSRSKEIQRILLAEQKSDGRWQNDSDRMRENDPLIATSLAIGTLCELID